MKVIINSCYGGFGLSAEAFLRAIERGAAGVKTFTPAAPWTDKGYYRFEPFRDGYSAWVFGDKSTDLLLKDDFVYTWDDANRTDPVLVQIVAEMGDDANGDCAKLKIVEVPDGVEFEIVDYDGREHIAEAHRTWA